MKRGEGGRETGPGGLAGPEGLTPEGFEALLARLDPDRERAGELYEHIRQKLLRLFEWRGCESPEDLADETFNRVAKRVAEGLEFRAADPYTYFCGVAHLVYKEVWRRNARDQKALLEGGEWPPAPPEDEPEDDRRLGCIRRCLDRLPADQRRLLLQYYQGENNIRSRKGLSQELGIPINALRIRVHRVRRKLEDCVAGCLAE